MRKRCLLGAPTWRSEELGSQEGGVECEPGQLARAAALLYTGFRNGRGPLPPPGIWAEIPCFHQVGDCRCHQIPLLIELIRRFLLGKELRTAAGF